MLKHQPQMAFSASSVFTFAQPKRHLPVTGRSGCPLLFLFFHFSAFQTKQTEQRAHKNRFSVIRVRFCSFSTPNPIPRVFQVFHFPFPSLILAIPFVFCFSEKNLARKRKLFDLVLFFSFRLNSSFWTVWSFFLSESCDLLFICGMEVPSFSCTL